MFMRLITVYDDAMLGYMLLLSALYLAMVVLAFVLVAHHIRARRYDGHDELFSSPLAPSITVIAPAFNEAAGVAQSVRALLNLRYPAYEVIVVNDGSHDATLDILTREFALHRVNAVYSNAIPTQAVRGIYVSATVRMLTVIDKDNGGKADALNCGINFARSELVCSVDADSVLEPDALLHVARPFVNQPDLVVGAGAIIRIANGSTVEGGSVTKVRLSSNPLVMFQVIEYLRAYLGGFTSWSRINGLLIISGAFGVFRCDLMRELGGYRTGIVGEDVEIVTRMHHHLRRRRQPYRIAFVAEPVCWTEAPETFGVLRQQRRRWHRGLAESLFSHFQLLNPTYGVVGLVAYPYFFFVELLGPVLEAVGYVTLAFSLLVGLVSLQFGLLLWIVACSYGMLLTLGCLVLEELAYHRYPRWRELLLLCACGLVEGIGYRQLNVFFRLEGLLDALRRKHGWGTMLRAGFDSANSHAELADLPA